MKRILLTALITSIFLFGGGGCSKDHQTPSSNDAKPSSGKAVVYTVNYPLAYFAERIGGHHVEVVFPMKQPGDPAFWEPSEGIIREFQKADIILLNGANYAKWLTTATLPESKFVNTSDSFEDQWIEVEEGVTHSHGTQGEHTHQGHAFTTWLDFELAAKQALAIKNTLMDRTPDAANVFLKNYNSLANDLDELDRQLKEASKNHPGVPLIVSHPIYQYLAKRYQLNLKSVHWEPDRVPSKEEIEQLRSLLAVHSAKTMLWEAEPMPETVELLQDAGVESVVYSPCANRPAQGDFLQIMKLNVATLIRLLSLDK